MYYYLLLCIIIYYYYYYFIMCSKLNYWYPLTPIIFTPNNTHIYFLKVTFNITLTSLNEYGAFGERFIEWSTYYAVDEIQRVENSNSNDNNTNPGTFIRNVVNIVIDEDVTYLGNYIHSKW